MNRRFSAIATCFLAAFCHPGFASGTALVFLLLTGALAAQGQVRPGESKELGMLREQPMTISDGCEAYVSITGNPAGAGSKKIVIVERNSFQYSLKFDLDAQGKAAGTLYSVQGETFREGDELIMLNADRERMKFTYQAVAEDGHAAVFPLSRAEVEQLAASQIETLFLKNNSKNQMLKFSLNESCKFPLNATLRCFEDMMRQ